MKTLLALLLIVPAAAAAPPSSVSAEAPRVRQDVEGKRKKKQQRKQRKQTAGRDAQGGEEGATPRKQRKPRKPLEVVPMGTERKARREAEGLTGAGRQDGKGSRKAKKLSPPTRPVSVTRAEDAASATAAAPRKVKETADPATGGPGPTRAARPGKDRPVGLGAEMRTHWSRLARLDQLSQVFLESGSMEAYQRADRLRGIENERFHTAMSALRKRLGPARVDGALERVQSRGGKWERSDWLRGEGKRLE